MCESSSRRYRKEGTPDWTPFGWGKMPLTETSINRTKPERSVYSRIRWSARHEGPGRCSRNARTLELATRWKRGQRTSGTSVDVQELPHLCAPLPLSPLPLWRRQNLWHVISLRRIARDSIRVAGFAHELYRPAWRKSVIFARAAPKFACYRIKSSAGAAAACTYTSHA